MDQKKDTIWTDQTSSQLKTVLGWWVVVVVYRQVPHLPPLLRSCQSNEAIPNKTEGSNN